MKHVFLHATIAILLATSSSYAATVNPTFTDVGSNTTTAQNTALFRADLTGLGLSQISQITINDSNSGVGGSSGAVSGFDVDAIFLDIDGDANTLGDQISASSFAFSAGSLRPGGTVSPTAGALFGSSSDTEVDEAFATLDTIDAIFFTSGGLSLGDGGSLTAFFSPDVAIGSSLFLFVGEVGDNGESIDGLIEVSDTSISAVPLPAGLPLLAAGIFGLGIMKRRRKTV